MGSLKVYRVAEERRIERIAQLDEWLRLAQQYRAELVRQNLAAQTHARRN